MSNQENISKETKKTRRKRSHRTAQQIKLAVIMIMVSVLVLSASTFAWYRMSKTANIENMEFTADTLGNLLIAPVDPSSGKAKEYSNTLTLVLNDENKAILLPATTADGYTFKLPMYDPSDPTKVIDVDSVVDGQIIDGNQDKISAGDYYVYKKDFYIKTGDVVDIKKTYNIKLNGTGTYLKDKETDSPGENDTYTSLRAVRVSFVVDGTTSIVYEPYSVELTDDASKAQSIADVDDAVKNSYGPSQYAGFTLKQNNDNTFTGTNKLCTLTEGEPKKITMYVWFEGNDDECANQIALNTISGQIQFEAEEATTP